MHVSGNSKSGRHSAKAGILMRHAGCGSLFKIDLWILRMQKMNYNFQKTLKK